MRSKARILWLAAVLLTGACGGSNPTAPDADDVQNLEKIDVVIGTGAEATNTKRATVHYEGFLYEAETSDHRGAKFDSSRDRNEPYTFTIGVSSVIDGWHQGVPGMRVGGRRTLIIPSRLGYGSRGSGTSIPPNSALVFDIELLALQ
jgi:FKBP-type peptidyl-prolyl cis-trans isomerase FkpA